MEIPNVSVAGHLQLHQTCHPHPAVSQLRSPLPPVCSHLTLHSQPADHSRTLISCRQPTLTITQPTSLVSVLRPTVQAHHSGSTVYVSTVRNMLPSTTQLTRNTNPFYIGFIEGDIRICQGCRSILMDQFQHPPLTCVLHVLSATHFEMPLQSSELLERNNLPPTMDLNLQL